jgi:DNA polymerase-3 subunit delta'
MTGRLIGHDAAVRGFLAAATSERLHHAWLLAGPAGVGKARFAGMAAQWLLADAAGPAASPDALAVPGQHPVAALLSAGSHPDFRLLRRLPKDKGEELARSITVDQVRALQPLLATTPGLSFRRVVVIDAADDLERSAANALLKNLEEPPAGTIFLIVSHAPGRLLPTIRSRCRQLRFGRLDEDQVAQVLRRERQQETAADIQALVGIADGAPGAALRFAGLDVAGLDAEIDRLAREGDPHNERRGALARSLSARSAQARFEAFLERAPARIAAAARKAGPDCLAATLDLWREARGIADRAVARSDDPQMTVFAIAGLVARLAPEGSPAKA